MARVLKQLGRIIGFALLAAATLAVVLLVYFNIPVRNANADAKLGITFSQRYAADIHLDWKEAFLATLDDLGARKIRLPVYWDLVEKREGEYDFSDMDWQLEEAGKRNAEVILVVGQKVPRWPECAIPEWAKQDDEKRKSRLLKFVAATVKRYQNNPEVKYWQVENEPFLRFGICPKPDADLLDREIALVRLLDPSRKIIVTDSGELSLWYQAAKRADIFGTTLYRTIWKDGLGFFDYPIGPRFFHFKYWMNKALAKQNNAIVIELQAEPWISGWTTAQPLEDQFRSMNAEKLKENVEFAQKVGFPEIYLWGAEWWYWLKTEMDHPELWEMAKGLFFQNGGGEQKAGQEPQRNISAVAEAQSYPSREIAKGNFGSRQKEIPEKILIDVPFTSQAPFAKWDAYHEEACEEASLVMLKYFLDKKSLNSETAEKEIQKMIEFQLANYGDYKDSSAEEIVKFAADFYGIKNLKVIYDFQKEDLKEYLSLGRPIIVPAAGRLLGNPNFTSPGPLYHNLVLAGYDGNAIITNDPGTRRGRSYRYNLDVLYHAIHDFPGKKEEIEKGRKAMIVLE